MHCTQPQSAQEDWEAELESRKRSSTVSNISAVHGVRICPARRVCWHVLRVAPAVHAPGTAEQRWHDRRDFQIRIMTAVSLVLRRPWRRRQPRQSSITMHTMHLASCCVPRA